MKQFYERKDFIFRIIGIITKLSIVAVSLSSCQGNIAKVAQTKAPIVYPVGGTYTDSVEVTITGDAESTIYYSIDGSTPSIPYSSPIVINALGTTTLKTLAMKDGFDNSSITTEVYEITEGTQYGTQYALTTNINGLGNISTDPTGGAYNQSTVVTLTAAPESGWQFDGWSGDLSGTSNPATITMYSDKNVTATFSKIEINTGYYIDPNSGDDSNSGSITQPWRTIKQSIPKLSAGDVLYLRGGVYNESEINVDISGTSSAHITITNYPGEYPVIDGSFAEFRTSGNSDWEVHDASKGIYRSVNTYSKGVVYGYFGDDNGNWKLVPYEDYGPFSTDNEDYDQNYPYSYCGPGLYFNSSDNRIYVRLKPSKYESQMGYSVPNNTDPRQTRLHIFADNEIFNFSSSAAYIEINGVEMKYQDNVVECASGSHHITLKNCKIIGGRYPLLFRDGTHDITIDNLDFPGYVPPWIARSDVKKPSDGRPAHLIQGNAIQLDGEHYNIEIMNSNFTYHFDAIDATKKPHNMHIHDNNFNVIRDDVLQLGSAGYDIEINNNIMTSVAAGVSWNGSGTPPSDKLGTKYIHHNVIDAGAAMLYGRTDPSGELDDKYDGPFGTGMATGRAFGMHTKNKITGSDPWKIYNNTLIIAQDVDSGGAGISYRIPDYDSNHPHEVYNNIIYQKYSDDVDDSWYAFVLRSPRVQDGSQIFDGNLYYREERTRSVSSRHHFFGEVATTYGGSKQNFESLAEFIGSAYQEDTKSYYSPGWENSGVEANPQLNQDYYPSSNGPAASGAVDLSSKGWPGVVGETFRGALAPVGG